MMPDIYEEGDDIFVNLSSEKSESPGARTRKQATVYGSIDLASGYPAECIWTTKDRRRIAVPNMADSHLLNTIAFLRRNSEKYKMQICTQALSRLNGMVNLFDIDFPLDNDLYDNLKEEARQLWDMPTDKFLRMYVPIFSFMLQEAYKRKLLIDSEPMDTPIGKGTPAPKVTKTRVVEDSHRTPGKTIIIDHD